MADVNYTNSTLFKGTVEEMRDAVIELQRQQAKVAQLMENLESIMQTFPKEMQQVMQEMVITLREGNVLQNKSLEQSDRIIHIEQEQLGVQTTQTYLQAREWGRESDLGLTQEQVQHGIMNTQEYFQVHATPKAIRDAEFEKAMNDLADDLADGPVIQ